MFHRPTGPPVHRSTGLPSVDLSTSRSALHLPATPNPTGNRHASVHRYCRRTRSLTFACVLSGEAARERPQAADRRDARAARRDHRRRRRRGRPHDAHLRQRQARGRAGSRSHRRDRRASARQGEPRSGVRGVVHAQRQRRDDRHDVGPGERLPRGPDRHHEHAQRRRRARRDHQVGGLAKERAAAVVAARRRRDVRRKPERHQRLSREGRARAGARSTPRPADCRRRATSAAGPE